MGNGSSRRDVGYRPGNPRSGPSPDLIAPAPSLDLPILVYHHVCARLYDHAVRQLKYLQDNGFHTVSFTDLADYFERGKPLPLHPVIISFDDGWENQLEYGFPILQKYHNTATFYVVTNYLDQKNFVTTEQLKTMIAADDHRLPLALPPEPDGRRF
jgi:peptidoglycan/xylan/chitin deacetylase (PgdA/CDA1 family)